jgi:hypothetical protein
MKMKEKNSVFFKTDKSVTHNADLLVPTNKFVG